MHSQPIQLSGQPNSSQTQHIVLCACHERDCAPPTRCCALRHDDPCADIVPARAHGADRRRHPRRRYRLSGYGPGARRDGFAPDRNEDMWNALLLINAAHLSREGATFATFTAGIDDEQAKRQVDLIGR